MNEKQLVFRAIDIADKRLEKHPEYESRGFLHFSFVIYDKKIIAVGMNRKGKNPLHFGYRPDSKIHSEIDAWRKARGLLKGEDFEMINIRLDRNGEFKLSKPCKVCWNFLQEVGCISIRYTTEGWAHKSTDFIEMKSGADE